MNIVNKNGWLEIDIRFIAVAASLLISLFTGIFHTTPNDDAYTYIRTAEIFTDDGIAAAFAHYQWATYSILIGTLHKLLGIDLFSAGYLLNALFYGLLVYSFISIVKEINDSQRVLILTAITVLVYPQLNEFRQEIIRDIGFWSLALFSLWQFMVFGRSHNYPNAIAFCIALLLAATFRAEAIYYLLVIPLSLLFDTRMAKDQRIRYGFLFSAGSIAMITLVILIFRLGGLNLIRLFLDFVSVYTPFITSTLFPAEGEAIELGRAVFNDYAAFYSSEYITLFLVVGLIAILFANVITGIGGPFLIILLIGYFRKLLTIPKHNFLPLLTVLLANSLILLLFILITRFLSSRYTMLFCIVLSLFVPLVLDRLLQWSEETNRKKVVLNVMGIFLLYCAFDAYISFGYNKSYLYDAADWVALNSESNAVITNNHAVAYFSGRVENYDLTMRLLTEEEILLAKAGSLIAVEVTYDMTQLFNNEAINSKVQPIIAFPDETNPRLIVYRKLTD